MGSYEQPLTQHSGRALHHPLAGVSIPDEMSVVPSAETVEIVAVRVAEIVEADAIARVAVAGLAAHLGAAVKKEEIASVTMIVVATGTVVSAVRGLVAQRIVTAIARWKTAATRSASVNLVSVSMSAKMALLMARGRRVSNIYSPAPAKYANSHSCRGQGRRASTCTRSR